ncbi:cupin domain-containing protein [Saccharopolyspora sp. NPDC050389]|uniref:cupin domain-containing protein n=1 Tax=Saccharopolyspora sp. NPDC050389 TaxID=3155516 RepID=UPI0033F8E6A9
MAYYFPGAEGVERSFSGVTIRNIIAGPERTVSVAAVNLDGVHPPSISKLSDRAYYIIHGEVEVTVGSETFVASSGDAVFVPKATRHSLVGKAEYVVVNVPPFDPSAEEAAG